MSLFNNRAVNVRVRGALLVFKRFQSKKLKSKENDACQRALKHFDDFYKSLFGEKWPSVRLALLSKQKHVAVVNNFGDNKKTEEFLLNQGAFNLRDFLEQQKKFVQELRQDAEEKCEISTDEIISQQLCIEEEKEAKIHPKGIEFKANADYAKENDEELETDNEYIYKPEDARTSLSSDLMKADFDLSRIIMPDNKMHVGNLNEFIPATQLRGAEQFIPESEYYKYYQSRVRAPVTVENENELDFPESLNVYCFDRGDISDFPDPSRSILDVYNYLALDGGELLAALALGVQPNDTVLDMCSSSGNIAYCILQSLRAKFLLCTDDRSGNLSDLFSQYLYNYSPVWNDVFCVSTSPAYKIEDHLFDKVLVNVPSTEDRTALFENDGNIFHVLQTRKRLQLPEMQSSLLTQGLKLVKPGGTVLYTSATLSPIQNDGVVNQALSALWDENGQTFTVINLSPALRHTSLFFNFGDYLDLKFGNLVVPFVPANFGPRYICKIKKNEEEKLQDDAGS